jgi:hypothetical protein
MELSTPAGMVFRFQIVLPGKTIMSYRLPGSVRQQRAGFQRTDFNLFFRVAGIYFLKIDAKKSST